MLTLPTIVEKSLESWSRLWLQIVPAKFQGLATYSVLAPVMVVGFFALSEPFFSQVEALTFNARIQLRHRNQDPPDERLFLVGIDDHSLEIYGRWPWRRKAHASFTRILAEARPALISWDIIFDLPSDDYPEDDVAFVKDVAACKMPVISAVASTDPPLGVPVDDNDALLREPDDLLIRDMPLRQNFYLPFPALREVSEMGVVNVEAHEERIIRWMPMFIRAPKGLIPSLSLRMLMSYLKASSSDVEIRLGDAIYIRSRGQVYRIPINDEGAYQVNYRYETNDFQSGSYAKLFEALQARYIDRSSRVGPNLGGKIVLIGQISTALTDVYPSPLAARSPLPLMHLNILDNILKNDYLHPAPKLYVWLATLLICLGTSLLLSQADFRLQVAIPLTVLAVYVIVAFFVFVSGNIVLPLVTPSMAFTCVHIGVVGEQVFKERRARQKLRDTFSAYVPQSILESLYQDPDKLQLGGASKDVCILFSDIRSFTTLTEHMESHDLVKQLNEYFTAMVEAINSCQGTLHKFIGDAIMAVWGDVHYFGPETDAAQAVRASLAMSDALSALNHKWRGEKRPAFKMGIGINHGRVVAGNIGAPQRMEFTVVGDPVNLASRLEGLTKHFNVPIVVGQSVYDLTLSRFTYRPLAKIRVMGRSVPVATYQPIAEKGKRSKLPFSREWLKVYNEACIRFGERRFDMAARLLEACVEEHPEDGPSQLLLSSARSLRQKPPPHDWDGAFEFGSK